MTPPCILISSGDPSGAMHAARLARILRERTGAELFGLGTPEMREAGVELIGQTSDIAVVGLSEALELLPRAWRLLGRLEAEAERRRPSLAILVDSPDFNLRLARRLKGLGIPIVYFISPQIWAWRSGRVNQIRDLVAKMLVIFPFEEQFYRDAGVPVEFVGHPLVEAVRAEHSREHHRDPQRPRRILGLVLGRGIQREHEHHHDQEREREQHDRALPAAQFQAQVEAERRARRGSGAPPLPPPACRATLRSAGIPGCR